MKQLGASHNNEQLMLGDHANLRPSSANIDCGYIDVSIKVFSCNHPFWNQAESRHCMANRYGFAVDWTYRILGLVCEKMIN